MAYSQQPQIKTSIDALPSGYTLNTNTLGSISVDKTTINSTTINSITINRVLREDEFSVSYLASLNTSSKTEEGQGAKVNEVILVEFCPRSLSHRDPDTYNITLNSTSCHEEYEWGLLTYLNKVKSFLKINHPNIVNIKDCFKAHNTVYVITDLIYENAHSSSNKKEDDNGKGNTYKNENTINNWTTLINHTKGERLPEAEVLSLTTQLLDALDTVHSTGQILSDLTPSSILMQPETGQAVIAHLADPKHIFRHYNKAIAQNISPGYSACEQYYASDKQGSWTDIYAMGSILYKIISGTTPDSAAYRLTHFTDLNKDSLTPATKIKHIEGEGFNKYSNKLLKAIDHAMQLQSIDRPQTVHEWQEELGITISSPSTSDASDTAHNSDNNSDNSSDNNSDNNAEIIGLSIPGITHSPNNFIQVPNENIDTDNIHTHNIHSTRNSTHNNNDSYINYTDKDSKIDFVALSQLPVEENRPNKKTNLVIGVTAVLLASVFGAYYYISQPVAPYQPNSQPNSQLNSQLNSQPQPELDGFASKSNDPYSVTDNLLETTSLEGTTNEETDLIGNTLGEETLDEETLDEETLNDVSFKEGTFKVFDKSRSEKLVALTPQTPLTPLWLLDVPLVKRPSTPEDHPHYLIDSTIKSMVARYPSANEDIELTSLKNTLRLDNNRHALASIVTSLTSISTSSLTSSTETTAENAENGEPVKARKTVKTTNVARTTNNHRPNIKHSPTKQKTRQQYQRDWALKQRKKALANNRRKHPQKRPHSKTQKQYQNEWRAKQERLKKRAAWKQKKQQLEIMEIRKTTSQIESQLLNDNDW